MHSMNLMEERARLPFPLYDPEIAAKAILFCAEHPRRSMVIGGAAKAAEIGEHYFPVLTDFIMRHVMFRAQKRPANGAQMTFCTRFPAILPGREAIKISM